MIIQNITYSKVDERAINKNIYAEWARTYYILIDVISVIGAPFIDTEKLNGHFYCVIVA